VEPRTSDDPSPRRTGPLYRPVGQLVNRLSAAANARDDFVKMKQVANLDFRADLWRGPDLRRPDTLPAMLEKYQMTIHRNRNRSALRYCHRFIFAQLIERSGFLPS
jgi:hypothetical protein